MKLTFDDNVYIDNSDDVTNLNESGCKKTQQVCIFQPQSTLVTDDERTMDAFRQSVVKADDLNNKTNTECLDHRSVKAIINDAMMQDIDFRSTDDDDDDDDPNASSCDTYDSASDDVTTSDDEDDDDDDDDDDDENNDYIDGDMECNMYEGTHIYVQHFNDEDDENVT